MACGPGGVGKTTVSAAVAATVAARLGGRVLVVTVDPARRLADALGIASLGNVATRVPDELFRAAGEKAKGELHAAQLDMSESWDALVRRHAPDAKDRSADSANPLYQNITRRFAQGHDYIAMERLYELHEEGDYDLLVVDTPPSRNALDLLDAPARMAEFFSSRLLHWLTVPYRSRLVNLASRPFYQVADRVLGSQFLQDLADFFILFQTMRDGFVARAEAVNRLLRDTWDDVSPRDDARSGAGVGGRGDGGLAEGTAAPPRPARVHKVLPASLLDPDAACVADELSAAASTIAPPAVAGVLAKGSLSPELVPVVLEEVAHSFANFRLVATREAGLLRDLASAHDVTATVGYRPGNVADLAGLLDIGARIWADPEPVEPPAGGGGRTGARTPRSPRSGRVPKPPA